MSDVVNVVGVLLVAWVAPLLAVTGFAREMESRHAGVANYRGRTVFSGLGVAWLVTALASAAFGPAAARTVGGVGLTFVVPGAFALGLLDDAFGGGADKGFRGHLRALLEGRLTTGMLKALGIGLLALMAARFTPAPPDLHATSGIVRYLAGAAAIALTANLVNLVDLRPARALKVYVVLAVPAAMAAGSLFAGSGTAPIVSQSTAALIGALLVLGPAAAVWPYDAGERGMLGDAGANAAGGLAGYLAAAVLPMPWIAVWAAVLLGVNLLSEKVSFSAQIERNAVLRGLDGLGREDSDERPPE